MIDDRELALKKLTSLYASDTITRAELIYEIFHILKSGLVKFNQACENLKDVDPVSRTHRFLDIVYGLYLYLHPNTVTMTRCLRCEGEFGVLATRLIENHFTNRFDTSYMENSAYLIKYVDAFLKPIFETAHDENESHDIQIDLQVLQWIIQNQKDRLENNLEYYDNPFGFFNGFIPLMIDTLEYHRVECYTDAFNFIARLKSIMIEIHRLTQFMEKQRSLKSVEIPRITAQHAYDMIQTLLKLEPHEQNFMKKFKADIDSLGMGEDIYRIALEFVTDSVYRAFYHLGDWIKEFFLEEDDIPVERDDDNENLAEHSEFSVCCDRNRGKDYYAYCLKYHTTTDMTAEEIHELGKREVDRLQADILRHAQVHARHIGTLEPQAIEEGLEYLRKIQNSSNIYLDTKEGEYRFVPEHMKKTSPAGFYEDPSDLHPFRKIGFYTDLLAYIEGWALYSETLCTELELYDTTDSMLAHLLDQLLRAVRLVIDTGIHYYGWHRDTALDYMNTNCPFPLKNNEIEIDRYISAPGHATAYLVGQTYLLRLRDEFSDTLPEFNTRILQRGPVPLALLKN